MRSLLALGLCLALLCPAAGAAEGEELWTRTEGDGSYVTVRLPCPEGADMTWQELQRLSVRYAGTGETVPLVSGYNWEGFLFATVPAAEAERPLEVFQAEEHRFPDCVTAWEDGSEFYDAPSGADALYYRGVLEGDQAGNLNAESTLTRAEAFTLVCRLLSLEPAGDPGFADVSPEDWWYDTASAARGAGIAAADVNFNPTRTVTRGEITVMLARALERIGWLTIPEGGDPAQLDLADAGSIPDWALGAYLAFAPDLSMGMGIFTRRPTGETDPAYGWPEEETLAQWEAPAARGEVIEFLYNVLCYLPWYPNQAAID